MIVFIVGLQFLKKLHRQERVVEEVKVVLKPHYAKKHLTKEEYKDILRRAVPKVHSLFYSEISLTCTLTFRETIYIFVTRSFIIHLFFFPN